MKRFILSTIITCGLSYAGMAQVKGKISGSVSDNQHKIVEFPTATLLKAKDSTLVKGALGDANGHFEFESVNAGEYLVSVTQMGYKKFFTPKIIISEGNNNINLASIVLVEESKQLGEVTVSAQKPFIERQVDKTVVNVENSIMAAGSTALEVLERSPNVMIDKDGNISLKGKQGVRVMIDGKISYLSGQDLANFLRNLSAEQLAQIEIMTNPSSKYDAAGTAGIINIKLKKNVNMGLNGSANVGVGHGKYLRENAGINLNYRNGKVNAYGNYSWNERRQENTNDIYRYFRAQNEMYHADGKRINFSYNHSLKAGVDYFISDKTTIGILVNGSSGSWDSDSALTVTTKYVNNKLTQTIPTANNVSQPWKNISTNLNLKHTYDSTGRELTVDLDYAYYDNRSSNDYITQYFNGNDLTSKFRSDSTLVNKSLSGINQYSLKVDYTLPVSKVTKWGMGVKASYVITDNDLRFYEKLESSGLNLLKRNSNQFVYKENINAAYLNYQTKWNKFSAQLGLRAEWTIADGKSTSYETLKDSTFTRDYLKLFPSAFVQYEANKNHTLGVTYSRRIDRPGYDQLNPFVFFLDPYTYQVGNPYLRPQLTNSFELTHSYKGIISTTINYSHTSDFMSEILKQNDATRATYQTVDNLAKQDNFGVTISAPVPITKWWMSVNEFNLNYTKVQGAIQNINVVPSATNYYFNSNNTFSLGKDYKLELGGWYVSGGLWSIFKINSQGAVNFGIQKTLLEKKATLKLNVQDIFFTNKATATTQYGSVDIISSNTWDSRQVRLTFSYRFGNSKVSAARNRSTGLDEEKSRVKNGGN
ncbi:outer membrane beta-barrel family protein [Flectobacillus roseus]|uniref:outer membrane beta-barrel family protein n=1 Tax=Flectobacillus roseus TaxID=502259 RepID=UPI0024B68739|nr:outer membrane beta-barrel family protein [Flectobacillus roseus]MDI9869359.1 outer membrane beta-barrel family protein [Flectobacillus roseus]